MRPHIQTLAKPAASASSRYITSIAVSSAPLDAGDRNPAPAMNKLLDKRQLYQLHPREVLARGAAPSRHDAERSGTYLKITALYAIHLCQRHGRHFKHAIVPKML